MHPIASPLYRIALYRLQGRYFAHVAELPGCMSSGATQVEAVENARLAIRAYLFFLRTAASFRATVEVDIAA